MAGESPVWRRVGRGQAPARLPTLLVLPVVLMQFMGDQPKPRGKDEIELLYELLKVSEGRVRRDLGETPLVTIHSNHPQVFIEHLLDAGGCGSEPSHQVPAELMT